MEETILTQLREDHGQILLLTLKVESTKDRAQKHEAYLKLKQSLISHLKAEEEALYSKLSSQIDLEARELADEAQEEHRQILDLMDDLDEAEIGDSEWGELFFNFKERLLLHFEEEEDTLFEEVKEDFNKEELSSFYSDYESIKEKTNQLFSSH